MSQIYFEKNGNVMEKIEDGFQVSKNINEKPLLEQFNFFIGAMGKILTDETMTDKEKGITCTNIINELAMKSMFSDEFEGAENEPTDENGDFDIEIDTDDDDFGCEGCEATDCPSHPDNCA
jgi:hypothetical protein